MPLHPDARAVVEASRTEGGVEPGTLPAAVVRAQFAANLQPPANLPPVGRVYERTIPGPQSQLRVRIYEPDGTGPFPALVWFHGGGWVLGTIEENDKACRVVCRDAGAVVTSVEYRLAPENPYPAAAEDAYAAVRWVAERGAEIAADPTRIAVGGESAGGNLAAVVSLMSRDRNGPPLALQLLVSPVVGAPQDERPSYRDFAEGFFMSRASMEWFFEQYPRTAADLDDSYLLPLRSTDLAGLVPALVMTAEYDVLRDEGEDYAKRLTQAGVPTELVRYDGQIHGYFGLLTEQLSISAAAHDHAVRALRAAFDDARPMPARAE